MAGLYEGMSVKDINALDGVKDLPMSVRGKFIKALKLESQGDDAGAMEALNEGIAAEAALKAAENK